MKSINFLMTAVVAATGFVACTNSGTEAKQDATSFNMYVDSVGKLTPVYTTAYWTILDEGYQVRVIKADQSMATLDAEAKAEIEESKAMYAVLKNNYEIKIAEAENQNNLSASNDYRQVLRNNLFGVGMVGTDLKFDFVTAGNLLNVYRTFVNTVADNKDSYTREDWDEIKVLYEALDTRKNAVEKDLPNGDNTKIAGLKIKFSAIKATHRGGTKAQENKDAKT